MRKVAKHIFDTFHISRQIYLNAIVQAGVKKEIKTKSVLEHINAHRHLYAEQYRHASPLNMIAFERYTPLLIDNVSVYLNGIRYSNLQEICNELHHMARDKFKVKDCEIMGIKVYKEQYNKPKYWKTINRFCEHLKCRITYTFNDSPHYYYAGIKAPNLSRRSN